MYFQCHCIPCVIPTMHLIQALFLCFVAATHGKSLGLESDSQLSSLRIVGGQDATKGEFPFIISLQNGMHLCGGSIINEYWILTAAHCLWSQAPGFLVVKAGKYELNKVEESEQVIKTSALFIHEKYPDDKSYDIGLAKLEEPFKFNDFVQPIKLPKTGSEVESVATLTGWGLDQPSGSTPANILQKAELPVIDVETCKDILTRLGQHFPLQSYHVCTDNINGISGASGDSGSPLIGVVDNHPEIVGIAVWAIFPYGTSKAPTGYMKVSSFIDWIESTMNQNS